MVSSPVLRQAIIKSGMLRFAQDELAVKLAALCEQFYLNRAIEPLTEAAGLLASLTSPHAQAAGNFYLAMVSFRQGDLINASRLLEATIKTEGSGKYKARAIQSLGIIYRFDGDHNEAFRLYQQAIMRATGPRADFVTIIRAGINLSELHSSEGNRSAALADLRQLRPAVQLASQVNPVYAPLWCNEVAFELLQAGRLDEARRFAAFAIASPFARAYPEWRETAQEIEQQAEAKAALNVRPALQQARKTSIKPKLRLVKKPCPRALPAYTRRRIGPVTTIKPEQPRSRPTLEQISFKIQIRAPSF